VYLLFFFKEPLYLGFRSSAESGSEVEIFLIDLNVIVILIRVRVFWFFV
jgi:hypothetical protein